MLDVPLAEAPNPAWSHSLKIRGDARSLDGVGRGTFFPQALAASKSTETGSRAPRTCKDIADTYDHTWTEKGKASHSIVKSWKSISCPLASSR
eukprot:scaffold63_cov306-Pinguiococcus_pyrenoidosus.AAC.69